MKLWPILLFAGLVSSAQAGQCEIAWSKEEFFTNKTYKSDQIDKQVLLYMSSNMTKSEAESTFGIGVELPIPDMPIGLNFTQSDYDSWSQSIQTSSQYESYKRNQLEVKRIAASKEAKEAYQSCLKSLGGLDVQLEDKGSVFILELAWYQPPTGAASITVQKPQISNGVITSNINFPMSLKNKEPLVIQVQRKDPKASLVVTVNSSGGGAAAVIPGIITPMKIEPRIWWQISSAASPGLLLRHYNSLAIAGGPYNEYYFGDTRWKFVTRGRDDKGLRVALSSFNLQNYFLRHENSRLRVNLNNGDALLYSDSTFYYKKPLNGSKSADCFSLEASNFPGFYVRQRPNGEIWIDRIEGTQDFTQQATFCKSIPK